MVRKDEKAVSPVIGVILMVAITVILAAVIASFVFGMGSNVKKTYVVSATASQQDTDIVITYQGGPDHQSVSSINVTCTPSSGSSTTASTSSPSVGDTLTCSNVGTSGRDHVVVTATFADGTTQVILDTYV